MDNRLNHYVDTAVNKGHIEDAFQLCNAFIETNSESPDGYRKRAWLFARSGRYTHAIADLDKAIKLNPENPDYHFFRGWWSIEQKDFDAAISAETRVIELELGSNERLFSETAHFLRAFAAYSSGDAGTALSDLTHVGADFSFFFSAAGMVSKACMSEWLESSSQCPGEIPSKKRNPRRDP